MGFTPVGMSCPAPGFTAFPEAGKPIILSTPMGEPQKPQVESFPASEPRRPDILSTPIPAPAQPIIFSTPIYDGPNWTMFERREEVRYPETPKTDERKFDKYQGGGALIHLEDGSIWEKDRSGNPHGGAQYKRWENKRSYERGDTPQSVWTDGRVRK